MNYPFFQVEIDAAKKIAVVYLNRPEKRNAMDWSFWRDLPLLVADIDRMDQVHAVVIAARGKSFSTGLDLPEFIAQFEKTIQGETGDDREKLFQLILTMQEGMKRIAESPKVWVAAIHRHCIGGALDLISACDLRFASKDASISLRETKVAIVADMGSLNRLPGIIGDGNTRYMAFTGRDFSADECARMGLISRVFETQEELLAAAVETAAEIAANSGLVLRGVKKLTNYQRDHGPTDGMDYVAAWNTAFLDGREFRAMIKMVRDRAAKG